MCDRIKLSDGEVVLFQGDSITDGGRGRNQEDLNHVMGHGYAYSVGAKMHLDNIEKGIKTYNRGVSGNRIADIYGRWMEDCINLKPTMLSVLVGINDAGFYYSCGCETDEKRYEKIYRLMLDEATESNPDICLVIMEPFVGEYFEDEKHKKALQDGVAKIRPVCAKLAQEYNAAFVPLQELMDEYQKKTEPKNVIWDGIHPTVLGHEIITRQWIKCVSEKFGLV